MKRLWIALVILGVILGLTLLHTRTLQSFTDGLAGQLEQAQELAREDAWPKAAELTRSALERWRSQDVRLHVLLRHADTDSIYAGFQEVLALLDSREYGEYAAANARLICQLELLSEAEQLTLKNIL
ncbi:DUF4363 family protein [Pseudoflavonifractor phocaeensis]|uniref:DUF4363 family protein n=1 Tax=Pseudoflavonifractor phocaeensis TaxID=1870988 RepID=UPI00195A529F|nr:DUF4363 family protein [Pseudoflavonifractor phocaeensis]